MPKCLREKKNAMAGETSEVRAMNIYTSEEPVT